MSGTDEQTLSAVRTQVEFYFSDSNFRRDKFLRKVTAEAEGNFVPIATLLTFNLVKKLTTDEAVVAAALKSSETVVVSEDGKGVKRKLPLPERDDSRARTVYVENLPRPISWEEVRDVFKAFGNVLYVRLRRKERVPDGSCFVEFADEAGATAAIAAGNTAAASAEAATADADAGGAAKPSGVSVRDQTVSVVSLVQFMKDSAAKKKQAAEAEQRAKTVTPNVIVRVAQLPAGVDVFDAKQQLREHGAVAYLELEDGGAATEGKGVTALARFKSAEEQSSFVEKCVAGSVQVNGETVSAELVQGEEEKQYWDRMWAARRPDGRSRSAHGRGHGGRRKRSRDHGSPRNTKTQRQNNGSSAPAKTPEPAAQEGGGASKPE